MEPDWQTRHFTVGLGIDQFLRFADKKVSLIGMSHVFSAAIG